MKKGSSMNFQLHTLHNKMEWWRGKIGPSLKRQGRCLMSIRLRTNFGPKPSTPRAMPSIGYRLYLNKILKKTAYKLLTGNKPKVHYFRVFGSKCFILNKKSKRSKFAPKVDEGFMLGYGSNAHAYRVFNKTSGCVEIAKDVTFDESNR